MPDGTDGRDRRSAEQTPKQKGGRIMVVARCYFGTSPRHNRGGRR